MRTLIQEIGPVEQRILTLGVIRDKARLMHKCQRKMSLSLIDPDNYKIFAAAGKCLRDEINNLCHDVGL